MTDDILTLFFCGTTLKGKSNKAGEVVSTIASQYAKKDRDVTWKIFPGPGAEDGCISWLPGLLHGDYGRYNWDTTVREAVEFTKTFVRKRPKTLKFKIIILAYSRGAIIANIYSNHLKKHFPTKNIDVTIMAIDPIPGPYALKEERVFLSSYVTHYYCFISLIRNIILAPTFLIPCLPNYMHDINKYTIYKIRGDHMQLAGIENGWVNYSTSFIQKSAKAFIGAAVSAAIIYLISVHRGDQKIEIDTIKKAINLYTKKSPNRSSYPCMQYCYDFRNKEYRYRRRITTTSKIIGRELSIATLLYNRKIYANDNPISKL